MSGGVWPPPRRVLRGRPIALLLSAALAVFPDAPASGGSRDLLQAHLDAEPATLDPILATDVPAFVVQDLLFTPLVALDRNLAAVPGLARSWTVSSDSRTFVFELDPTATFDDGAPVTARDVRFTIERIRDPNVPAVARKADFEDLESVEAVSDRVVRVRFSRPYSERLIAFHLPILPEHVFARGDAAARAYGRRPVGNGSFRFVRWEPARAIVVERRRDAAGRGAILARVVFRILSDPGTWVNAALRGELDEFRVPAQVVERFDRDRRLASRFRLVQVPRLAETTIVWNCRHAFLGDVRARQALARAIPRARIIASLYHGRAREISGPYPADVIENAPDVRPLPYSPQRAAALLWKAGWRPNGAAALEKDGRRASFDLLIPAGQNASLQIAQILRGEFERLGIAMGIRALDWPALSARLDAGEFDACLSETVFFPPNLDPYVAFHSSQAPPRGQNTGFYANPAVDRLLESARAASDRERRIALYREIHRRLAHDQPNAFLFTIDSLWAVHRDLRGVETSPLGLSLFHPGRRAWRWK
ncbi:MAG TPA: ABC transporter substrate-binding protein [Thermoanaerobaculia bacterium]|jgi:peptide/nickel transport system substrate-binding protein